MRLINTTTLQFSEFIGSEIPRYAILSHRWASTAAEVSYKDYRKGLKRQTSGYSKIVMFCEIARLDNLEWAWIDTACIDKRSSAELSEAINSMFAWYRDAWQCYVYLSDVKQDWRQSCWWTRGWCLQELIAPKSIIFFNQDWERLGTKSSLALEIEQVTAIPRGVLLERDGYKFKTVAQKMSWAAGRRTTRIEDRAYSLLGIFHINMSLLYGEGEKAFTRLQLEILQKYSDQSIMSWTPQPTQRERRLALAQSPDAFADCSWMKPVKEEPRTGALVPFSDGVFTHRPSNAGIEIVAHARRLRAMKPLMVGEQIQHTVWAINLKAIWAGHLRVLPCVLLLVEDDRTPNSFKRLSCLTFLPMRPRPC